MNKVLEIKYFTIIFCLILYSCLAQNKPIFSEFKTDDGKFFKIGTSQYDNAVPSQNYLIINDSIILIYNNDNAKIYFSLDYGISFKSKGYDEIFSKKTSNEKIINILNRNGDVLVVTQDEKYYLLKFLNDDVLSSNLLLEPKPSNHFKFFNFKNKIVGYLFNKLYIEENKKWKQINVPIDNSILTIYPFDNNLYVVHRDNEGNMEKNGIIKSNDLVNWNNLEISNMKFKEHFIEYDFNINAILEDKIYFSNFKGYQIYDVKTNEIVKLDDFYTSKTGITFNVFNNKLFYLKDHKLYCNSNNIISEIADFKRSEQFFQFYYNEKIGIFSTDEICFFDNKILEKKKLSNKNNFVNGVASFNNNSFKSNIGKFGIEVFSNGTYNYRYNLKYHRSIACNNLGFFSLIVGVRHNDYTKGYGNHLIFTDAKSNTSNELFARERDFYFNQKIIDVFNINGVEKDCSKIYFSKISNSNAELIVYETPNNVNSPIVTSYDLPYEFELKTKTDIETFHSTNFKIGNGVCAFFAESTYNKKPYLFIYDFENNSEYKKIDLTKISTYLTQYNTNPIRFRDNKNGQNIDASITSIHSVLQNDEFIYVFLRDVNSKFTIPICINKSNFSSSLKKESMLNLGFYFDERGGSICPGYFESGFNYLTSSKGFASYYKNRKNNNFQINVYNKNFDKKNTIELQDIEVKTVNDYKEFLIIGGYSKSSGYKGYPNPKLIIINKNSNQVTYSNVIPKKNGTVSSITLDKNNNVIIGIGSTTCYREDTDDDFISEIIVDKINHIGKFEYELNSKK